ncbi:MAG TPA: hypothetical protein DD638_12065, partial [Pasteurellaceae bacterium]|nr:hypothetical protein [Pasteurellaceae bacterium]
MAGQQYQVKLEDKILNPKLQYVKAVTEPKTVETPKFRANVEEYEFYQDPNQAHIRQSIVHLTFTHPVDRQKLEKAVSVNLIRKNRDASQDIIAPLNFKIRYGEYDLSAWITSDSVSLASSDNQYIQTKIDKNLTALLGHNILAEPLEEDVEVPTKFSLQLDNNIQYVNNQQNEPEQILSFEFNQSVKGVDLAKNLQTVLLPEKDEYWSYNQITQQVLDESEKITPELIPTQNHYANVQNFRINIPQQRCLYVYVKNQFSAQGGYQLPQAVGTINCAGNYPKYVGFVGEGSLLALSGDKKITIATRNFDKIQLDIGRVQEAQLRHIANLNFNTFQNPNLGNLKFDDISNFSTTIFNVPNHNPSKSYYESFDINQHNNFPGEKGIFWLKVSGLQSDGDTYTPQNKDTSNDYNWQNDSTNQYDDYRLIVLTDLGIIAKKAADGSQSVFVQSIHSGKPIAYASIKVVSRNGSAIEQAYTNTSGVAFLPSLENYKQEQEPVMYLVEHNGDQSFLPIGKEDRTLNYSRFDVSGVITEQDTTGLKATLINDRGIYRPNETLHTAIITKAVDWNTKLGNIPLQLEVTSPRGNVVNKQVLSLADNGFNTFDYTLPENAESGEWMVQLYISKQDKKQTEIGSMTFQVQEFQPDTLKIKTQFNTQETLGWVSPHDLTANVHLTNLFGTPAQKRLVKANLTLHNLFPKFSQYSDYQFYDNRRNKSAILYEAELDDQYTDEQGNAKFVLDLSQYAENTAQMLYFTADGFETGSGRGVSGVNSVMVSAQPWLIGYQSKQDLNYLKQNSNADVHLIAVNSKLEKIALENLTATLFERKYVSVLTQQNSGAYKYESKLVETQKTENLINITQEGITLPLSTEQSGDFVLIITDNNKLEVNRINYSVIGNHNVSTEIAKNTELKLKLNKNQFLPGEQIEVVINAPYAGSGLITIERDRVYAHQWFKTDTNQSVQHIKLPDNFEGNGYINVQFSRD